MLNVLFIPWLAKSIKINFDVLKFSLSLPINRISIQWHEYLKSTKSIALKYNIYI